MSFTISKQKCIPKLSANNDVYESEPKTAQGISVETNIYTIPWPDGGKATSISLQSILPTNLR